MNRRLKTLTLTVVASALLQGCGWNAYKAYDDDIAESKAELDSHMQLLFSSDAAEYIDTPPKYLKSIKIERKPSWLTKRSISLSTHEPQTISTVMKTVMKDHPSLYPLLEDETGSVKVRLDVKDVSLDYLLESIKAQADVHYEISGRTIRFSKFDTETFQIASLPGARTFGMGTGENSGTDSTEDASSDSGKVKSGIEDYSKISAEKTEFITSIEEGVREIVSESDGKVIKSKAGTNLTVIAPPSKMALVDRYVNQSNEDLTRQIVLLVRIITFTSNNSASAGIDWNLVKESSFGAINLGSSFNNTLGSDSFLKLSPTRGGLAGTELLISAIKQQGKVSVTNELPVTLLNYRPSRFEYKDNTSFVANVINNESNETGQTTTELDKDTATDGYTMFAMGKILDDQVLLQLSSELQALKDFDLTAINDVEVKSPQYTQSLFAQTNTIKYGETLIANAFTQKNSNMEETSQFDNQYLGGNLGETKTIQTVVLVTPTLL
ncbi:hypothetical protein [Vibrio lentus]|uniref:hypothetical protein n=1 Tax=Vibrio lentus TaxID=136468 RepID=UPI001E4BD875|nr:hypothetical protein [Vibrio lentus]MCC4837955.1 hypothetical protein [Vibrio lentus]